MMETSVPFDTTAELFIYLFILLAFLCIGLSATVADVAKVLKDRPRTHRILLANVVIPPIVAVVLGFVFPLEPVAQTMLLLLAFAPGGINAVQFSTKVPGEIASAGAILVLLSAVSFVTAPVAASYLLQDQVAGISLPFVEIVVRIGALFLLPAAAGMVIRHNSPDIAEKLYKPAMLVSTLSFIASVVLSIGARQEGLEQFGRETALAFLAFLVILMAVGWALGGPSNEGRQVLSVSTNLRNVGLVYVLADGCCADNGVAAAVLGLMALMVLPNLFLTVGCALWRKRHLSTQESGQ